MEVRECVRRVSHRPKFRLKVALLMAGASVTGAVFGILAGRGFRCVPR